MKLHLGCGERYIKGFVHIDIIDRPHIDHVSQIDDLSYILDSSVDLIYASHVLEHFKRASVNNVLQEWHRVLKPGGILRIAVPDFAKLCEVYQETDDLSLIIGPIFGRQNYLYNIHYNVFDYNTLKISLESVGFESIQRYDWTKTEHADVDDYSQSYIPHMDKKNGKLISLNVEATKR